MNVERGVGKGEVVWGEEDLGGVELVWMRWGGGEGG